GNHGAALPKAFWLLNDRNPLSPWWYVAFSPVIEAGPSGLFLLRRLIDPFLACSTFLLIHRLSRGRHVAFPFSCSLVVLAWTFSSYLDHVTWNFLGALGLNLLSIWAFCAYVDGGRRNHHLVVASLVLFLVSIGTYTLQAGGALAIAWVSLIRSDRTG